MTTVLAYTVAVLIVVAAVTAHQWLTVDMDTPVMDYRWRPPETEWCRHPQCRAEVAP